MESNYPMVYDLEQVKANTGLGRSLIYESMKPNGDPTFPKPFAVSARRKVWLSEEVRAWVLSRAALRGKG